MKPHKTGIKRVIDASRYSLSGFAWAWRSEAAFRQELCATVILLPIALLANVSIVEQILMVACLAAVLIVELLNSAIEAVVDRVGSETHELSGAAKDMGSAAVLVSLLTTGFVWIKILLF